MSSTETPKPEGSAGPEARAAGEASKGNRIVWGVGAVALAIGAAYGTGRYQGVVTTEAADQRAHTKDEERGRATREFDAQRDRAIRLEARRRLHLALLALEDRNFGTAETHVGKAKAFLERAKGDPGLDKLAQDLANTKLVATDDLGASRQKLLDLVKAFDAALPSPE